MSINNSIMIDLTTRARFNWLLNCCCHKLSSDWLHAPNANALTALGIVSNFLHISSTYFNFAELGREIHDGAETNFALHFMFSFQNCQFTSIVNTSESDNKPRQHGDVCSGQMSWKAIRKLSRREMQASGGHKRDDKFT